MEDASHDLGLRLVYLRLAVLSDTVTVGDRADWHSPLLCRPALPHSRPLPEVVELYLSNGRHQTEGLHVDGVHDGFQPNLVGLDHLHESGGGVHSPAEPVRLPADDCVEPSLACVFQHPLKLRTLLRPSPSHLLIACDDGESLSLAMGLHLVDLFEIEVLSVGTETLPRIRICSAGSRVSRY